LYSTIHNNDVLNQHVDNLWEAALSETTQRTYKSALLSFLTFMTMNSLGLPLESLPSITEEHLILFVTHCQKALKLKYATIKLYLAGIRYHYIRAGHGDPTINTVRLPYILRGVKKLQCNVRNKRLPITSEILINLCKLLERRVFSPFIDLMLQCVFKMAFVGFLRCGEFTVRCKEKYPYCICIQDITLQSKCYIIKLRSSKCDPFRESVNITIYENNVLKPVETMVNYIQARYSLGAKLTSPLFLDSEFGNSPLSRDHFISLLRQLLLRLGYDDNQFSGHSFRIGAATSAAASGVEDHIIQTLGRWSSDCYIRYIHTDSNIICKAQNNMCSS